MPREGISSGGRSWWRAADGDAPCGFWSDGPLGSALHDQAYDCTRFLIEAGAESDQPDSLYGYRIGAPPFAFNRAGGLRRRGWKRTIEDGIPIFAAIQSGVPQLVKAVIDANQRMPEFNLVVFGKDEVEYTPLSFAEAFGNAEIIAMVAAM